MSRNFIPVSTSEKIHVTPFTQTKGLRQGLELGLKQGIEQGLQRGQEQGIQILILDNLDEGFPKEKILTKLQKRFNLTKEQAEQYFGRFTQNK